MFDKPFEFNEILRLIQSKAIPFNIILALIILS